jgi:branched-chain amino acid transport system substrate-binding protein
MIVPQGRLLVRLATAAMLTTTSFATPAYSADKIKIGFMSTLSGTLASLGTNLRDGFNLGLDHLGGKIGGLTTEAIIEDDQAKPDVARQIADKFVEFNKVDVVTGILASNVMMAIHAPITNAKVVLISPNAGPSPIAGDQCSEYFFTTSWQGDNFSEAMGAYLQAKGTQNVYLMAPNYQAGKDVLTGFKRFFKSKPVAEVYTPLTQVDFSAELAQLRAAKPAAVFAFYPGGLGIQFVQQYVQAGLSTQIPLYTSYTIDNLTLPAIGDAAIGMTLTASWNDDIDNAQNRKFVADFKKKYNYAPSFYSAQAYDAAMLLDSAVRKVGGKIEDKAAFLAALKAADFKSVRGNFKFNTNHFPIQDFYLGQVIKGDDGKPTIRLGERVLKDHHDAYAANCPLK